MIEKEYLCEVMNLDTGEYDSLCRPVQNRTLAVSRAIERAGEINTVVRGIPGRETPRYDLDDTRVKWRIFEVITGGWEYGREELV